MVEGGIKIHWAEAERQRWREVEKKPDRRAVKKRMGFKTDVPQKSTPSYPYEMRVGAYLAMRKGPEEMMKLKKKKGITEDDLETKFMEQKKPGICYNSTCEKSRRVDIEKLDEEEVASWIRRCASGMKIRSRDNPQTGKTEHFVVLLAMSPRQGGEERADKEEEEQQKNSHSEARPEVNFFYHHVNTFNVLGTWPDLQGQSGGGREEREEASESQAGC